MNQSHNQKGYEKDEYMGLAFHVDGYECTARWCYTGFRQFRIRMGQLIGIDIEQMERYCKRHPTDEGYIKIGVKPWNAVKSPLKILLDHSDSSGFIDSEDCKLLYPEFKRCLDFWESFGVFEKEEMKNIRRLLDAIQYCAENGKYLEFC